MSVEQGIDTGESHSLTHASEIDAAFDALEDGTELTSRQIELLAEYDQEVHLDRGEN